MKVLFMGTPDFARECLDAVYTAGHEVVGAVTQPDKPKGRGYKLLPPPVKVYAEEKNIPVFQPETLKNEAFLDELKALDPEIIVVAAYGKILPKYILDYPEYGCICAHGSILPRHRGAAPIQRAILEGDTETGITVMYMDEGIDTGDMILKMTTPITDGDNFETLHDRLAKISGEAVITVLSQLENGTAAREKQEDEGSTYAAKITKDDCNIAFSKSAKEIFCQVRAMSPFPLAFTKTPDGRLLKIVSAELCEGSSGAKPGTVAAVNEKGFEVACGDGKKIRVTAVLPEGKGRMSAADFVRGRRLEAGDMLKWQK
ncbi:MAG: methionyl-tRNA formyltransferase [Clostridia bacterium]|nr:methionyl-tRNA formyltransferase [Clostridia bacterium]